MSSNLNWRPVWFDSLGAKSSCTFIKTPDLKLIIDPGCAVMQPSFPASTQKKLYWLLEAKKAIKKASKEANIVIISHYHYDHFTDFNSFIYKDKLLLAKNPNEYINESQFGRARIFFDNFCKAFGKVPLEKVIEKSSKRSYKDPLKALKLACKKDFHDYNKRRKELLEKGRKWFFKMADKWNSIERIPELKLGRTEALFPEGRKFKFGKTTIRFTEPLFHGIEYAKLGWVFATVVEYEKEKIIHTSDLEGPTIEDQAEWLMEENPNVLILDGPSTYLIPYMLNLINFRRASDNILEIIRRTDTELIILDHHLLRERLYKKRLEKVYECAKNLNKKVLSVAEYLGKTPKVLE